MKARVLFVFVICLLPSALSGLTVKLGTLAPSGTPWIEALKKLDAAWSDATGGEVRLQIYPGGIVGSEQNMVRQMRFGQLQAAALTGPGLETIVPDAMIPDLPFLFDNGPEAARVLAEITPEYKRLFAEKGFVLLGWTIAGWVNFFSTSPVVYPRDLQAQRLAVSDSDSSLVEAWRVAGFRVVPLPTPDLMASLSSGLVDALYTSPLAAAAYQWFGVANHMCSLDIAPLLGGIVMTDRSWRQIPEQYRQPLEAAAESIMKPVYSDTERLQVSALRVMKENGLVIDQVPPAAATEWRNLLASSYRPLVGTTFSSSLYARIVALIDAYRSSHAH